MDFTFTDEQPAITDLAYRILSERLPAERIRQLEQTDSWFADDVWAEFGSNLSRARAEAKRVRERYGPPPAGGA